MVKKLSIILLSFFLFSCSFSGEKNKQNIEKENKTNVIIEEPKIKSLEEIATEQNLKLEDLKKFLNEDLEKKEIKDLSFKELEDFKLNYNLLTEKNKKKVKILEKKLKKETLKELNKEKQIKELASGNLNEEDKKEILKKHFEFEIKKEQKEQKLKEIENRKIKNIKKKTCLRDFKLKLINFPKNSSIKREEIDINKITSLIKNGKYKIIIKDHYFIEDKKIKKEEKKYFKIDNKVFDFKTFEDFLYIYYKIKDKKILNNYFYKDLKSNEYSFLIKDINKIKRILKYCK